MAKFAIAILGLAGLFSGASGAAADVKVTWQEPESYQDIRPSNQSRSSFREMVFSDMEAFINELATALPDDQTFSITVTDMDLAGEVWPASFLGGVGAADVRLVKPLYIPRMQFSYALTDAQGDTLQSGDVKLKDMAFMNRGTRINRRTENLTYEKAMFRDWFEKTVEQTAAVK
ncbi:DUF3016 domain-containing protein [Salinimonas chungwhensis]|uniref:DUF3016 domain-containing protein n=1 Tax=Salinimonas chungwhensis TaxID=265425 RepID=UPI0003697CCE|nr:DUF3016 domain-containing protein [Salinimonas chungwhensis]